MKKKINREDVYDEILRTGSEIRSWQQDLFVKANFRTSLIYEAFRAGTFGKYRNSKGELWYIFYNSYAPWYDKIRAFLNAGKNPILEMHSRFREEAFRDGSYYQPMEQ